MLKGLLLLTVGLGTLMLVRGTMFTPVVTQLAGEDIPFDLKADWVGVCLSSEYEIPDLAIQKFAARSCWDGAEVPNDTIYITYLLPGGQCSRATAAGHFLEQDWIETRCFKQSEISGDRLVKTNGVYKFLRNSLDLNGG